MRTRAAAALAALVVVVPVAAHGEARGKSTSPSEPATSVPAATTASTPSTEAAASSAPSSDAPDTSLPPADRADGVLTIGTLLPVTGPGNQIGIAAINAVNVGVRTINEGSGVLDQPVRWVNASEGESPDEAQASVDQLLAANVDAVIGPASSLIAMEVLDELMAAGVLVCSPAATALSLNEYPDRELFFRTVPSDSLMAQAMAVVASNTGVDTYAVVYLDDQFGRPFAQEAIRRLEGPEIEAPYEVPFPTDATPEELADLASQLAELAPRTVLVIADSEQGWPMLEAMSAVFATDPPFVVVNDAMRIPPSSDSVTSLPAEFREQIQGLSPVATPTSAEPVGAYATNALDCLNLVALATAAAGTDDPAAIAAEMTNVSVAGTQCNNFAQCLEIAEQDRTYNYQGPNGIDFSARGDPAQGRIGIFRFDANGLDVPVAEVRITEALE